MCMQMDWKIYLPYIVICLAIIIIILYKLKWDSTRVIPIPRRTADVIVLLYVKRIDVITI